jgi:hypothetical protein
MSRPATVDDVLRGVPSQGWVGRRDRALLVLSRVAGLSSADIADLTAADVTISQGAASIRTRTATLTVRSTDDTTLCGPCALARWLHVLNMTVIYPDGRVTAAVIARSAPLAGDAPHACQTTTDTDTSPDVQPLAFLPAVDQWGILACAPARGHRGSDRDPTGPDLPRQDGHSTERLHHRSDRLPGAGARPGGAPSVTRNRDQ